MIIKTLELRDFRNYKKEEVVFHEKINILAGSNAQGKTNLIEAVNLLALGKSFRTRREQELVRFGTEEASVKGEFEKNGRRHTTEVRLCAGSSGKKSYFINGLETGTVADLLGGVFTIVFSPEDLRIVKGDPETRRRVLDRSLIMLKPLYYFKLKNYKHVLKSRNALLKSERVSMELLDIYDEKLAEAAAEVMEERADWLGRISEAAAVAGSGITRGEEELSVEYRPNFAKSGDGFSKEAIRGYYLKGRERDVLMRATEMGPHKDDFSVFASGLDLRVYGSQGQQRTAALSIKLAERELIKGETGEDAILLLDDVLSEFDAGRQERLMEGFGESQIFITTAGPFQEKAERLGTAKVIWVEEGRVR